MDMAQIKNDPVLEERNRIKNIMSKRLQELKDKFKRKKGLKHYDEMYSLREEIQTIIGLMEEIGVISYFEMHQGIGESWDL